MDERLVLVLAVAEAMLIVLVLAIFVGHAVWLERRRRRQASRIARAATVLTGAVEGRAPDQAELTELTELPTREQIAVFDRLGENLAGEPARRLVEVATQLGLILQAKLWCTSRRWGQRLRGLRLLTLLAGGEEIVPDLLWDRRPEVRAQAALWVGAHPDAVSIERLLEMLGDPDSLIRYTAQDSLMRVGRPAIEPLLHHLEGGHGAVPVEALELASGIADARFLGPALGFSRSSDAETRAGAATLVGSIGGSHATSALIALLGDVDPRVRSAAAQALGRLGHWPAGSRLADCLRDPAWDVRMAAGVALRALGAVGVLLLKKMLTDDDRFARGAARKVLDLPGDDPQGSQAPTVPSTPKGDLPPPPEDSFFIEDLESPRLRLVATPASEAAPVTKELELVA